MSVIRSAAADLQRRYRLRQLEHMDKIDQEERQESMEDPILIDLYLGSIKCHVRSLLAFSNSFNHLPMTGGLHERICMRMKG